MFLITGATGVVGRETVRLLCEQGASVAAVTRNPNADFPPGPHLVHPADITELETVDAVLLSPRATGSAAAQLLRDAVPQTMENCVDQGSGSAYT